jgi:hypothetical protein
MPLELAFDTHAQHGSAIFHGFDIFFIPELVGTQLELPPFRLCKTAQRCLTSDKRCCSDIDLFPYLVSKVVDTFRINNYPKKIRK